jgi:hypothetical protein
LIFSLTGTTIGTPSLRSEGGKPPNLNQPLRNAGTRTNLGAPGLDSETWENNQLPHLLFRIFTEVSATFRIKRRPSTALAVSMGLATILSLACAGQTPTTPAPQNQTPQPYTPSSTVILSRSVDDNGNTTSTGSAASQPATATTEPAAADAERLAVRFTDLDLEVHLQTVAHRIAVRAHLTVRNDGKTPLLRIPLQLSSSLSWEQVRIANRDVAFHVATLNSDADHTGQLHEATVPLAAPLAPGEALTLDVDYSGVIVPSAQRLLTLGTPQAVALHSDWDEISPDFTGLRGFGNVVWYPVASVPVILGDGSRLFDEIGRQKLALTHTRFSMRLTVEFPHSNPPTVALVNGRPLALTVADAQGLDQDLSGIATGSFATPDTGFLAPSLFIAVRKAHPAADLTAFTLPDNDISVQSWLTEAAVVTPFIQGWLGQQPRSTLTLLDLPDPQDAPYETGALLATSLSTGSGQLDQPDQLDGILVHTLTHAWIQAPTQPPPNWLNEGLATFLESLWVEKRHGRDRALGMLEADRAALALAEPSSPGASAGHPLALATAPVYYRTKAAYVLWMLRDIAGDNALSAALRAAFGAGAPNRGSVDSTAGKPAASLQALLKQAGVSRDLSWFFSDWIETDKGLPDLTISSVFPNAAQAGTWLVAVSITNSGYAAADVPVTVRTAKSTVTERVFVPAHGNITDRLVVVGPPTQVQVNDGAVPETEASVHITDIDAPSSGQPVTKPEAPRNSSSSAETPPPSQ